MVDPALAQLMDMGIPGERASAALRRAKGDVMSAAERVFAGEFDDVPSDEEHEPNNNGLMTTGGASTDTADVIQISEADEDMSMDSDGNDISLDNASSDEDADLGVDIDDDDDIPGGRLLSDPYAGIFFSKDRTETIFEPVEQPQYVQLTYSSGSKTADSLKSSKVRILGRAEWMSGCPEGNEQSFLFQLYSMLAEGDMPCSHGCGQTIQRNPSDFFALLPDFATYVTYLRARIRQTCINCSHITCLACGEKADRSPSLPGEADQVFITAKDKGKNKAHTTDVNNDCLLHCPNAQGVLIGVGLHMIEEAFNGSKVPSSSLNNSMSVKSPPAKKQKRTGRFGVLKMKEASFSEDGDNDSEEDDSEGDDSDLADYGDGIGMSLGRAGTKVAKGTGYAGKMQEDRSGQVRAEQAQLAADEKTILLLSQVRVYLPSFDREGGARTSDHLVHPTALAHLRRRSGFVNDLLRNDSLLDMSNRGRLYRTLFDWLEVISSHEALASMLAMPQMRPVKTETAPNDPNSVVVTYEGSASPRELLENCVIQAQAALKGLQGIANATREGSDEDITEEDLRISMVEMARRERALLAEQRKDANYNLKMFCDRIISSAHAIDRSLMETKGKPFVERMRESLPRLPVATVVLAQNGGSEETEEGRVKIYEEWAGRARFQYCDLAEKSSPNGTITFKHAFDGSIKSLEGMDMPKRSLAIAKELAILTTSLPVAWHSTIFLRVDETRVDVLKALIIGPEGTPYENGCFIFDIFLPVDYNQRCPSVKSMTTNGGLYRYNPNLYADGKVCLSLLGTWEGPGWISGQSTLLQVLISIQSLILCEEPYLNEPGWAGQSGSASSKAYSANVRRMTVIDAMANNLKSPPFPFDNEIKTHYRLKAKSIRHQLEKWKKLDDGQQTGSDGFGGYTPRTGPTAGSKEKTAFDRAAEEMIRLLDELERGEMATSDGSNINAKGEGSDTESGGMDEELTTPGKAEEGKGKKPRMIGKMFVKGLGMGSKSDSGWGLGSGLKK